jgi:hypothetical protein
MIFRQETSAALEASIKFILKVAAIIDGLKAFLIIKIKYSVSSVVQLVILAMKPAELIRQIEGLP